MPQLAFPLQFLLSGNAFSEQTHNHSDLAVLRNVVCALACRDPSTAGGFLFDSLNCLDMWFSRNGLPDPATYINHLGIEQGLRCKGRHLHTNVDNVDTGVIKGIEADLVTHTLPTV